METDRMAFLKHGFPTTPYQAAALCRDRRAGSRGQRNAGCCSAVEEEPESGRAAMDFEFPPIPVIPQRFIQTGVDRRLFVFGEQLLPDRVRPLLRRYRTVLLPGIVIVPVRY